MGGTPSPSETGAGVSYFTIKRARPTAALRLFMRPAGGTIEDAQVITPHESRWTTKLYDRTRDEITLDEVERISI